MCNRCEMGGEMLHDTPKFDLGTESVCRCGCRLVYQARHGTFGWRHKGRAHDHLADPERFDGDGYYLKLVKTPKGYNVIPFDSDCDAQMHGFGITVFEGEAAKEEAIKYAEETTKHSWQ